MFHRDCYYQYKYSRWSQNVISFHSSFVSHQREIYFRTLLLKWSIFVYKYSTKKLHTSNFFNPFYYRIHTKDSIRHMEYITAWLLSISIWSWIYMILFRFCTFHASISGLNRDKRTHTAIHLTDYILWFCTTASVFIGYVYHRTCKRKTTRTELFDGISRQTPQLSWICGCLLWVQLLIPATLSHCVNTSNLITSENISTTHWKIDD